MGFQTGWKLEENQVLGTIIYDTNKRDSFAVKTN
ncbi:hypothetical protein P872_25480 [Rhodonellum psychrophilum GCM71 = DSM 17998]|uniref:Uncharacterized protein n=2 Tax=Rhodonellum TaxID=336827 RepID=U5C6D7_9BACT|nr:hypothetical protein P872_25480 [Rhodonellum psychrophilum GCM71 = DSM 17998]SDZ01750.1 hypothetical protein SAMN05444412_104326 [Rhodonellum ikkaensis]